MLCRRWSDRLEVKAICGWGKRKTNFEEGTREKENVKLQRCILNGNVSSIYVDRTLSASPSVALES